MVYWIRDLSKPLQLAAVVVAVVLLVTGIVIYIANQPSKDYPVQSAVTSNYYAKAKNAPMSGKCLEENPTVKIASDDRTNLEYVAMSHLIDVPGGTNVDVKIASYSEEQVTGSNRYPDEYGSYNFVLAKQNSNWVITEFKRCG